MSLISRAVLTGVAALLAAEAKAQTDTEKRLAKMFSPILILTEESGGKWGDILVQKPEPVGIMGATSGKTYGLKCAKLPLIPLMPMSCKKTLHISS